MITQQELQGSWNQIKGKLKERWGQLTDNDLTSVEGSVENLVGMIQQKFGIARKDAEAFIDQCYSQTSNTAKRLAETAQDYMHDAADSVMNGYQGVRSQVERQLGETQQLIRRSPAESVAVAFGVGILTGLVAALLLRSPR